ncbi:enoyl-CoA hydratase/isomerase family protein [Litchfieldia alkalitelluris]|uniref:enoyl-CoA hydratase/isomerase family protein n=1 Tax=Litchfieldia alkalitelluris TaxID=304268 RepID=UPI0009976A2E|nr:enoyl-CoA hydratase/isomerase family protein [Litchfieldia alkalitelluris]
MKNYLINRDDSGVVTFIINRPDKRNAINLEVMNGLLLALEQVEHNQEDKLLVIKGIGETAFCSGGDVKAFQNIKQQDEAYSMLSKMADVIYKLCTFPKITVAMINGVSLGGGCELAIACDYRIASSHAQIGFIQGNLGITTGWGGGTILFEKIPYENALQMVASSKRFECLEAYELGFIHKILDAENKEEEMYHFLRPFLQFKQDVLGAYKNIQIRKWEVTGLKSRIDDEVKQCSVLWASANHHRAVENFLAKKK